MVADLVDIDAERERFQAILRPHLRHQVAWPVGSETVIDYARAMGWRWIACFDSERGAPADLFVKEAAAFSGIYRVAEVVEGAVTVFAFDTEDARDVGIATLREWYWTVGR